MDGVNIFCCGGQDLGAIVLVLHIGVRARGLGGCSPPRLGQSHYFWAKAEFFVHKPTAKSEKDYLLNEKNGIHFV